MAKGIRVCRVCGTEYEGCRNAKHSDGVFNWREVACSPECGMVYLERVRAARSTNAARQTQVDNTPQAAGSEKQCTEKAHNFDAETALGGANQDIVTATDDSVNTE